MEKLNDGAAAEVVCWVAPYGGALVPNVIPVAVVAAVAVDATTVGAPSVGVPNDPSVGAAPSCGVAPSVGVAVAVGVPKPNVGVGAAAGAAAVCEAAAGCVFEAPNVKPVVAVVCGVPNGNPDIFLRKFYKQFTIILINLFITNGFLN